MTNLWTDLESGPNPPETINVVVECLKGERNKYEYDEDLGTVVLDRVLHSNVHYPSDYGFIPQTWYDDEDPLDALVLVKDSTFPGCVIETRPIGLMRMIDDGEKDDKIIAVPSEDPRFDETQTLDDLSEHIKEEIVYFFETYKDLEPGKETNVEGYHSKDKTLDAIEKAIDLYENKFE